MILLRIAPFLYGVKDYNIVMNKVFGHLKTITRHKIVVGKLCFHCHLYRQGLTHDLSKYSPIELKTGFKYYTGKASPIDGERKSKGVSLGWLHHKGRNRHHWEYWLDNSKNGLIAQKMPYNYVIEMFCDSVAASMIYQGKDYRDDSALNYYESHQSGRLIHPDSDRLLTYLFTYLKDNGLDKTIALINDDLEKKY